MVKNIRGIVTIAAALFVLASSVVDPRVSAVIGVLALGGLGIHDLIKHGH